MCFLPVAREVGWGARDLLLFRRHRTERVEIDGGERISREQGPVAGTEKRDVTGGVTGREVNLPFVQCGQGVTQLMYYSVEIHFAVGKEAPQQRHGPADGGIWRRIIRFTGKVGEFHRVGIHGYAPMLRQRRCRASMIEMPMGQDDV